MRELSRSSNLFAIGEVYRVVLSPPFPVRISSHKSRVFREIRLARDKTSFFGTASRSTRLGTLCVLGEFDLARTRFPHRVLSAAQSIPGWMLLPLNVSIGPDADRKQPRLREIMLAWEPRRSSDAYVVARPVPIRMCVSRNSLTTRHDSTARCSRLDRRGTHTIPPHTRIRLESNDAFSLVLTAHEQLE